ncbi:MAG: hypothetical protein J5999_10850 [Oscillospiraceae bacterium]|nr:hypothetical protein [Oscillospiraceae bacterium]
MKRIQSACIMQTIRFQQKEDGSLPIPEMLAANRAESARYKTQLERAQTRYKIDEEAEQPDGSVIIRIRKEYNGRTDIGEYFN